MTTPSKLAALLGFVTLALGCSSASVPATAPRIDVETKEVSPPRDLSNLTFLLQPDPFGPALSHHTTAALRVAMEKAGYKVVVDPSFEFDAELLVRAFVWGVEPNSDTKTGRLVTTEHVRVTLVVVVDGHMLDLHRTYFNALDGRVDASRLIPAVEALSGSEKVQALSASRESRVSFLRSRNR